MTFSSIVPSTAYGLCAWVDHGVAGSPPDGWRVVWQPATSNKNYAVVLQSADSTALVIQGTKNLTDMIEDLGVETQVQFSFIADAQISQGSQNAMNDVLALTSADGQSLRDYLMALPDGTNLLLTGHSLGGNLASVFGPWIAGTIPAFGGPVATVSRLPDSMQVITFAAPTAGNRAFAGFLDDQSNYQAHFNTNDVIPHVWSTAAGDFDANNIRIMFDAPGPGGCPDYIWNMISKRLTAIQAAGLDYTQTKGTNFAGAIQPSSGIDPWINEMSYQHNTAYDLQFPAAVGAA